MCSRSQKYPSRAAFVLGTGVRLLDALGALRGVTSDSVMFREVNTRIPRFNDYRQIFEI